MGPKPHIYPPLVIVGLIWFFPPAAWYLMWKDKTYHSWFAYLLWIFGGATLVFVFVQSAFVIPKLMYLYSEFNASVPSPWPMAIISGAIGLAQVLFGAYLRQQFKKNGRIFGWHMVVFCLTQLTYLVGFPAYMVYSLVRPIYSLSSQI